MPEDIIRIGNVVSTHQDTVGLIRAESERVREYINGLSVMKTGCPRASHSL